MKSKAELKNRIRSITQTRQITKAMHLISIAKMKRTMARYTANSKYFRTVRATLRDILAHSTAVQHPFLMQAEGGKVAYVVIGGDKGFAGGYNHNVISTAMKHMAGKDAYVMSIGQVVNEFFVHRNIQVDMEFLYMSQNPSLVNARTVAASLVDLYLKGTVSEINIVYTHMYSSMRQEPVVLKLLPVEQDAFKDAEETEEYSGVLDYYPSVHGVLDTLVPEYMIGVVYGALIQSYASEQAARMNAMDSATRNADEFIGKLTLEFNRARQASITQEISEITAGADALSIRQ